MIDQGTRGRMREHDRGGTGGERGLHGLGRDMTQIHQHPQAIHLVDHLDSKRSQPVMHRRIRRRVSPVRGEYMSQGHITRAEIVHLA